MTFSAIYLASRSPRRRELLQQMAVDFAVLDAPIDETAQPNETPEQYVLRVATEKAMAGWATLTQPQRDNRPVLASDTAVVVAGQILGKPADDDEARHMLKMLSGRTHQVLTAVVLTGKRDSILSRTVASDVTFKDLSDNEIEWYINTKEGQDKAGSYAVQGLAAMFISHISGSYSAIMGLPVFETGQLLTQWKTSEQ